MTTYHLRAGDHAESHESANHDDLKSIADRARALAKRHGRDVAIFADDETKPRATIPVPHRTLYLRHDEQVDRHLVKNAGGMRTAAERAASIARQTGRAVTVHDEDADGSPLFVVKVNDAGAIEVRSCFKDDELDAGARDFKKHATEHKTLREWCRDMIG